MTNKRKLELLYKQLWETLNDRSVLNRYWMLVDGEMDCSLGRFKAGNLMAVELTYETQLWIHIWVSHSVKGGQGEREFEDRPKSLKLKWNRSAKNTAHNTAAIIGLVADAIESCNTYRIAGGSRLYWKEDEE